MNILFLRDVKSEYFVLASFRNYAFCFSGLQNVCKAVGLNESTVYFKSVFFSVQLKTENTDHTRRSKSQIGPRVWSGLSRTVKRLAQKKT